MVCGLGSWIACTVRRSTEDVEDKSRDFNVFNHRTGLHWIGTLSQRVLGIVIGDTSLNIIAIPSIETLLSTT